MSILRSRFVDKVLCRNFVNTIDTNNSVTIDVTN